MRNSPRASAVTSRVSDDPIDTTAIRAPTTRAPLVSCASPRSAPLGFCASKGKVRERIIKNKINGDPAEQFELDLRNPVTWKLASPSDPQTPSDSQTKS